MKKKRYLPFGYQMEKGEIIPHPDEGPLVQAIFSKYLERTALSTLAKYASLSGIPYQSSVRGYEIRFPRIPSILVKRIMHGSVWSASNGLFYQLATPIAELAH